MSQDKLQRIKQMLIDNADYYGQQVNRVQLMFWPQDLADLELKQIEQALVRIRREPGRKFMPLPSEIREKAGAAVMGSEAVAEEVVHRIWTAIARKGPYWVNDKAWPECAQAELGSFAWEVVQRWGGWQAICQESGEADPGIMRAQLRKSALSVAEQSLAGVLHTAPALPERPIGELPKLTKLGDFFQSLPLSNPAVGQLSAPKEGAKHETGKNENPTEPENRRGLPGGPLGGPRKN